MSAAYEAWGYEHGKPALLGTGAGKGDCDRIHRRHEGAGITVSGGVVVAVKTGTTPKAKAALQHSAFAAFRERGNLPAPEERASAAGPRPASEPRRFADVRREDFDERDPDDEDSDSETAEDDGERAMGAGDREPDEDGDGEDQDEDAEEPVRTRTATRVTRTEAPKVALVPPPAPEAPQAPPADDAVSCPVPGCGAPHGRVQYRTEDAFRDLCGPHRKRARGLMFAGRGYTPELAREHVLTGQRPAGVSPPLTHADRARVGAVARWKKTAKKPAKAPRAKAVAPKVLRARRAETVRSVAAAPLATRIEAVRRLIACEARAGGVEAVEQLVELAERCGGAGELAALVEALGGAA